MNIKYIMYNIMFKIIAFFIITMFAWFCVRLDIVLIRSASFHYNAFWRYIYAINIILINTVLITSEKTFWKMQKSLWFNSLLHVHTPVIITYCKYLVYVVFCLAVNGCWSSWLNWNSCNVPCYCYIWLPGQQFVLQTPLSTESPKQRVPPFDGDGLLQWRVLLEIPPPQLTDVGYPVFGSQRHKLFGLQTFLLWAYLIRVILETNLELIT
jgi:hypothetical protein